MKDTALFDLQDFIPYLLNQAADVTSREFETYYKSKYGMLRTEWRVVFHLGRYGTLTAKEICDRARLHKTKVSRAVQSLENKRYLLREKQESDRRHEALDLTPDGRLVFEDLLGAAQRFDAALLEELSARDIAVLRDVLRRLAGF